MEGRGVWGMNEVIGRKRKEFKMKEKICNWHRNIRMMKIIIIKNNK
jgi:hypothetical protein